MCYMFICLFNKGCTVANHVPGTVLVPGDLAVSPECPGQEHRPGTWPHGVYGLKKEAEK